MAEKEPKRTERCASSVTCGLNLSIHRRVVSLRQVVDLFGNLDQLLINMVFDSTVKW